MPISVVRRDTVYAITP